MSVTERVVRLAGRGDGVTDSGRYVGLGAPGDTVHVDGDVVMIAPGPNHVTPLCAHFPDCGGCQMQHVADSAYAEWASARIAFALAQQGVSGGEMMPVHLSPPKSRRRASLRAVRKGRDIALGFNAGNSHRIVDMQHCHVIAPTLFALVAPLRALLGTMIGPGQGAGVTLTLTLSGIDLMISNVGASSYDEIERLISFATTHNLARLAIEGAGGIEVIAEPRAPVVRLGGVPVRLPPGAFLQATLDGEAALTAAVLEGVRDAKRVADLFCGLGTFALPLSAAANVYAADAARDPVNALAAAARTHARPITADHRDLFRRPLTADELSAFDAVVFDPPRAGAAAQVAALARSSVPRIMSVSCNPATFARDAAMLTTGGYRIEKIWPVGQFRWSTHLELAALFVR